MSAAGRGRRLDADNYPTPAWCTHAILRHLRPRLAASRILEPAAGEGAIVHALRREWSEALIEAVEIRPECHHQLEAAADAAWVCDFLECDLRREGYDLAITNPPFSLSSEFALRMRGIARHTVMLARLGWLRPTKGRAWLAKAMPDVYVLPHRPGFVMSVACENRRGCGWQQTFPVATPRPKVCPECSLRVRVSSSDSSEYAWLHWSADHPHPRTRGIIETLPAVPLEERRQKGTLLT